MDSVKAHRLRAKKALRLALGSLMAAGLPLPVLAQGVPAAANSPTAPPADAPPADASDGARAGVQVFEPAYFRAFNPVTAADMVNRVPGFEIDDGEVLRGFGATAGNVLVNGERPSSKVLISEQLKRIPADAVVRVELISGGATDVDVRGQTQLANVVLKAVKGSGQPASWVVDLRHIQYSDRLGWGLQYTKAFALGETAELSIDLQAPNLRGRVESVEGVRNAAGVLTQYREQFGQPNQIGAQAAAVLKWRPTARDTLNFNAQVYPTWNTSNVASVVFSPTNAFVQGTFGLSEFENNYTAEIAGDWEHRFSPELSIKALALATATGVDQDDVFRTFTPTRLANVQTLIRTTEGGERVGRGVLTWRASPAHTLEFGAEGAFNFRDTTFDIFNNSGAEPVPQPLPVSDTRVEELRGEAFVTDVWKVSPALTLETGFTFEASRIEQTGDEVKSREFSYPKPRAILTWQASAQDQARLSLTREIAQLDFAEFASSINVIDAFSIIGNPDLEPEKTWRVRGEWERRFGKRGALTLAVFHDRVEDVQDLVVIGANDAYGNLGDGTRTGVELRGAAPLDAFGLRNADLRFSGLLQETEVDDPVTGAARPFSNERDWSYNITVRQQFPEAKWAWGGGVRRQSERIEFKRIEDILQDRPGETVDLFAESTAIKGLTIRVSVNNIFSPNEERVRTFYAANPANLALAPRATGVVARTETRKQKGGPEGTRVIGFRVSGTF